MRISTILASVGAFALLACGGIAFAETDNERAADARRADVEADWLRQRQTRGSDGATVVAETIARGRQLADVLERRGVDVDASRQTLERLAGALEREPANTTQERRQALYVEARHAVRKLALANPLLDFDDLLFVKRVPGSFNHMSDQNYGWFSRAGGGLFVLRGFKTDSPTTHCLTEALPPGSVNSPDLSWDGRKALFAYCKHYPGLAQRSDKLDKEEIPEDAFYHLYEVNLDGTGLRRLTHGKYDDFDGRYLPDGRIVFLSTRRGQYVQADQCVDVPAAGADAYVRCGGGPERPVAVYTLHTMDADGGSIRALSPFESFEWHPSIADDGRILHARWDYVDRDNMPYMGLWSVLPDGSSAQAVFGNHTQRPHSIFEARSIPNSRKLVFTASAHHAITGGSIVLLDPSRGADGDAAMTRLTPEVPYPEVEGWPNTYFANPYPLSEEFFLVAWSDQPMAHEGHAPNPANALGLYLFDALGNLEMIHRDASISSMHPLPIRPRRKSPGVRSLARSGDSQEGRMLMLDVYQGLADVKRGEIRKLRIVGIPPKTHPTMNYPSLGVTRDDPGKFVLGTVPVEADGSAHFRVPSGVSLFFQALDAEGRAVQTMRSAAYVPPGSTTTCIGCHEHRHTSPHNRPALAAAREPSRIKPGPDGSWPLDFDALVGPVLDRQCVSCHRADGQASNLKLTRRHAYDALIAWGDAGSLQEHVRAGYRRGHSVPYESASHASRLAELLRGRHQGVTLARDDWERLNTWFDTYAQRSGTYGDEQEKALHELRRRLTPLLEVESDPAEPAAVDAVPTGAASDLLDQELLGGRLRARDGDFFGQRLDRHASQKIEIFHFHAPQLALDRAMSAGRTFAFQRQGAAVDVDSFEQLDDVAKRKLVGRLGEGIPAGHAPVAAENPAASHPLDNIR